MQCSRDVFRICPPCPGTRIPGVQNIYKEPDHVSSSFVVLPSLRLPRIITRILLEKPADGRVCLATYILCQENAYEGEL
jgi:hypothetical protein